MKPGIVGVNANGAVALRRCLRPVRHQIRTPSVASPAECHWGSWTQT